jgi:hypothetical protein
MALDQTVGNNTMSKEKRRLKKKKHRERQAKKRVLQRRAEIREIRKIDEETERIMRDAREKITPIRNPKNDNTD